MITPEIRVVNGVKIYFYSAHDIESLRRRKEVANAKEGFRKQPHHLISNPGGKSVRKATHATHAL